MKHTTLILAAAWTLLLSATAGAQEVSTYWREPVKAPTNAFELTLGTGYTQPFGRLASGTDIGDLATAGGGFELGAGYRVDPLLMVGMIGQYHELSTGAIAGKAVRGTSIGIDATAHVSPYDRLDPWVKVGTGYRLLWNVNDNAPNVLTHGLQLVRLVAGLDIRTMPEFALGPMIGADLNMFLWSRPDGGSNTAIDSPRLNTFVYLGLQGRFDVGTMVEKSSPMTASLR